MLSPESTAQAAGAAAGSTAERATLCAVALDAVVAAARRRAYLPPFDARSGWLAAPGASFVTLQSHGELRGCIGSIEARRPLLDDVAANARAAALEDPRFAPLVKDELAGLTVSLSLLSPLEELAFASRGELLDELRPGIDGLVLAEGGCRATFLPAVWQQLPSAEAFVAQLERKAALASGSWSAGRRVWRYTVESLAAGTANGA